MSTAVETSPIPTLPPAASASVPAATTGAPGERCSHCGTKRLGAYCHGCGQHHFEGRITFRLLWREFVQRFLRLERGLLRTFRDLLLRPGTVARGYVDGIRRPYVNPLSYLLIATALSVLLLPFYAERMLADAFDPTSEEVQRQMEVGARMAGGSLEGLSPEQQAEAQSFMLRLSAELPRAITDLYSVLYLAFALILAAALKLFMSGRGRGYNFAETLVLGLFVAGQVAIISSLFAAFTYSYGQTVAFVSSFLIVAGIVLYSVRGFYDRSAGTFVLGVLSLVVAYIAYTVVVALTAYPLAIYRVLQAG